MKSAELLTSDTVINETARQFAGDKVIDVRPLGNGLINDTFLVASESLPFVLQRINRHVFPDTAVIMDNLKMLNRHLAEKEPGAVRLRIPDVLTTPEGAVLVRDEQGDHWRALTYIEPSQSIETIGGPDQARQVGFALGHFHALTFDLDAGLMHDTLPGFHIAPGYMSRYRAVAAVSKRLPESAERRYCTDFIECYQSIADDLESALQSGLLRLRIIHGDPKLNNFLFDECSRRVIGLIDLDTVKAGLPHYDIGDCLRSCCARGETPEFDLSVCEALLESYLAEVKGFFSEADYRYLYAAARLIPFELGLRFFTDYLDGNRYFKVTEPRQNLERAAEQFRLCADIIDKQAEIEALISRFQDKVEPRC